MGNIGASRLGVLVGGLGRAYVMARVVRRAYVVRARKVMGSRGVIISADEATKVTSTHQFFNFILEWFAVLCSVAMVAVIATIFGHISIGGSGHLASWRDEVSL